MISQRTRCLTALWMVWLLLAPVALTTIHAQVPQLRVQEVRVEGNERVETEAILRRVQLPAGTMASNRQFGEAIRRVYELGLFQDIQIDAQQGTDGVILTVIVVEKPAITELVFEGNDALDEEELTEGLGVRTGQILDESMVRAGALRIEEKYREKGFYLVEVAYEIVETSSTEVSVVYRIDESEKLRVARMSFVGNESIESSEILKFIATRPGSLLSFLNQSGTFRRTEFQTDLQRIRFLYYDRGFLDVEVTDPVLELSPDRSSLYVTIGIVEGPQYRVSDVSVSGDILTTQQELLELTTLTPGEYFSSSQVRDDIERLTGVYRDAGYANANVNMLTRQDDETLQIGVQYDIEQGELCYIGRIEFVGNSLTRDRVLRRQMAVSEGDQYSGELLRRSERFINQLGLFESVVFREQPDPNNPRIIDLQVEIEERPTRQFQVGAGFSSVDSFIATAQVSENNLFGRGQSLTLNAMLSAIRTMFVLSFVEPFLFDTRLQFGVDLFNRQIVFAEYERDSAGASANVGYRPFWDLDNAFWRNFLVTTGYQVENVRVVPGGRFGRSNSPLLQRYNGGLTSSLLAGVQLDQRDDRIFTRRGAFHAVNLELAESFIASENEFFRSRVVSRWYYSLRNPENCPQSRPGDIGNSGGGLCRLLASTVLRLNLELGYVGSTTSDRDVPIFERFYSGGPNSVRGFERLTLSPTEPVGQSLSPDSTLRIFPVGGHKELIINFEVEFPLVNAVGIRGVVFADAGSSLGRNSPYTLRLDFLNPDLANVLRSSVGFGFRWRSPIGPLRFEWGYPLNPRGFERGNVFEFSIQNSF